MEVGVDFKVFGRNKITAQGLNKKIRKLFDLYNRRLSENSVWLSAVSLKMASKYLIIKLKNTLKIGLIKQ